MDQKEGPPPNNVPAAETALPLMSQSEEFEEITKLTSQLSIENKESSAIQLINGIKQNLIRNQYDLASQILSMLANYPNSTTKIKEELFDLCQHVTTAWLNAPINIHLLAYVDYLLMTTLTPSNREYYSKMIIKVTIKLMELTLSSQKSSMDQKSEAILLSQWDHYVELIRTYTFQCMDYNLDDNNWLICNLVMALMLPNPNFNPNSTATNKQPQVLHLLPKLLGHELLPKIRQQMFHKMSLLLRNFITCIEHFISNDNMLLLTSSQCPSINNCSLLMQIIKSHIIEQPTTMVGKHIQLDCLMLLLTIGESKIQPSPNYNQILEFAIHIVLYLDQIYNIAQQTTKSDTKQGSKLKTHPRSKLLLYCGQLVAIILHRNCHELVKVCRKQSQGQSLKKLLNLYKQAVNQPKHNIEQLNEEQIIYKRLVLGFCGLLRINKMQTVIENTIKEMAPKIIRIIESQHGWHDEEIDEVKEEENVVPEKENSESDLWDEEYYQKHRIVSFEELEQVDTLLQAMGGIRDRNAHIFESIINLFDEKQSLMWMVELERIGLKQEVDD